MRMPPGYSQFPKYPVIAGTSMLAIAVSIAHMNHVDVSRLAPSPMIRHGESWRLLTDILPHANIMHLLFDVYWFWVLGTVLEEEIGHFRTALAVIMLGVGSSAFEFGFLDGGIGLSGVVYGLLALIWVLGKYDARFSEVVDTRTLQIMVGWFFFCIVMTLANLMPVANIAHGTGALLGALIGWASVETPYRKLASLGMVAVFLASLWCATLGRPRICFSGYRGYAEGEWGYDALVHGRTAEAARWYGDAVTYRPKDADYWYDLGLAQLRLAQPTEAMDSFQRAAELGLIRGYLMIGTMYERGNLGLQKDETRAVAWYKKAADDGDPDGQNALSWIYSSSTDPAVRNPVAALEYAKKAVSANRENPDGARLDTLAQAYFLNGQVDEAVKAETQALAVADPDDVNGFKERLEKYQMAAAAGKKRPGAR
jgi:membrane associated rhomboid family serine protease